METEERKEYFRQYYINNKGKNKEKAKQYYVNNKEKIISDAKAWNAAHYVRKPGPIEPGDSCAFTEKCCPVCGKYFLDKSRSHSRVACSNACRDEWIRQTEPDKHFRRKISMRLKLLNGQGVVCTEEERKIIEEKILAGKCEICGKELPMDKLNIDHDHATNKIRGIICDGCNFALGYVRDDPEIIKKLSVYLGY